MRDENQNMDERFKAMSEEYQSTYHAHYWVEAKQQLDNAAMDNAFKAAAESSAAMPAFDFDAIDDAFMDDAFKEAATKVETPYSSALWTAFDAQRANLEMDEAFDDAAKNTKASYHPAYWMDANEALEEEGLHYEYKRAYWNEAKTLLDKSDRRVFFMKWAGAAAMLLLLSWTGFNLVDKNALFSGLASRDGANGNSQNVLNLNQPNQNSVAIDEITVNDNAGAQENQSSAELNENTLTSTNSTTNLSVAPLNTNATNGIYNPAENEEIIADNQTTNNTSSEEGQLNNGQTNEPIGNGTIESNGVILTSNQPIENNAEANLVAENTDNTRNTTNQTEKTMRDAESLNMENAVLNKINTPLNKIPLKLVDKGLNRLAPISGYKPGLMQTLSLIANTGFGNSYNNSSLQAETRNSVGVEYLISGFGNKGNLELGLNAVYNRVQLNNLNVSDRTTIHDDFGNVERYRYEVTYRNAFYANANFLVNYKINTRHKLKFNVGATRLMLAHTNLAEFESEKEAIITNDNWGINNGLTKYDLNLGLGYEYRFSNRFAVQVQGTIGTVDRTDNTFFKSMAYDREKSITVGVKYVLFRGIR